MSEATRRNFLAALAVTSPAAAELLKDVPEVESAEVLTATANTVVVLKYPGVLCEQGIASIRMAFAESLPGIRVIILEEGMEIFTLTFPQGAAVRSSPPASRPLLVENIEPGNVVRLKTGGLPMTVDTLNFYPDAD